MVWPQKQLIFLFFFFNIIGQAIYAQGLRKQYTRLSKPERKWVRQHPFVAKKTMGITAQVLVFYEQVKKDSVLKGPESGGQLDAFRHALWMALLTKHVGEKRALKLGKAHEAANRLQYETSKTEEGILPDSVSSAMDLINNALGASLGKRNKKAPDRLFVNLIVQQIKEGRFYIIQMNADGNWLTCDGNIISIKEYSHQWNIPKCLVPSNQVP